MKFECGPTGAVDGIRVTEDSISLAGWAADLGFAVEGEVAPHAISTVEVFLNGVHIGNARSAGSRPDVAAHLGHHANEVLLQCGWDFEANGLIPREMTSSRLSRRAKLADHSFSTARSCPT